MKVRTIFLAASAAAVTMSTAAWSQNDKAADASLAHPAQWPAAKSKGLVDAVTEAKISKLISAMSLEEKVGQMIQADTSAISPDELRQYPLGSILAGGSSPPIGAPDRSPAGPWRATARAFDKVAMEKRPGHIAIPLLLGIDAVHGNNNVIGATLFPHNIGLGAMNNPALIQKIGAATAAETAASGFNWAFGPTLTVPQDDRWGRAYEGYSEDPALVARYAGPMVRGLQGEPGGVTTIQAGRVAASVKHFLGDGGTHDGVDQGDTRVSEGDLIAIHSAGYPPAVNAGAMTVMASFNSWNGEKMHGNKSLLTGVLKGQMGFDGLIVGDWNGHAQITGCKATDCAQTFTAGLDMAMAPDSWKGLYTSLMAQVKDGRVPMARIDDAVRRILRIKFKLGLFNPARPYAQRADVIGSPAHRAIARQAVQESLVLLKNEGVLPIKSSATILVAGDAANDVGRQSGGWTLSWQGDGNTASDFPGATSIYQGIAAAAKVGNGKAILSPDGSFTQKPDVAIVVFGEQPYAEMRGDVRTLEFQPGDKDALALLKKLKGQGIPVVSVFLSGRPLWVNPELNSSDAFVAAWFPGSEGSGIADVLIGGKRDFTGRLSFSWPKNAGQFTLNKGQAGYDPLFPLGYGLSYAKPGKVGQLDEVSGVDASLANTSLFFARGKVPAPFALALDGGVSRTAVDSATAQEGAMALGWTAPGSARISGPTLTFERETNAELNLQITYRMQADGAGPLQLSLGSGSVNLGSVLKSDGQWNMVRIPLKCFRDAGAQMTAVDSPFALKGDKGTSVAISDIRLATDPAGTVCPR